MEHFKQSILELIVETSTNLPKDVRKAIAEASEKEDAGTRAALSLTTIAKNIKMAEEAKLPICQDTVMLT
jgi:fumarate hydratase class I